MNWVIRPYRLADAKELTKVINSVCQEGLWTYTTQFVPTALWEHALLQPACTCHLLLVVVAQDRVLGWCELFPTDEVAEAEFGIGLLPRIRDQGIGTTLLRHALQWAEDYNYGKVRLVVRADNARAIHLYQKFGFSIQNEIEPPCAAPGRWWEMVRGSLSAEHAHHDGK